MKTVTFIRHGEAVGNDRREYIGSTDSKLTENGIKQAKELAQYYTMPSGKYHYPLGLLFVSPMIRCRDTADIIFPGVNQIVTDDLREIDFGIFEGKNCEDLADSKEYDEWVKSGCKDLIQGGEDPDMFRLRCVNAFRKCMEMVDEGGKACFIVHGGTIMSIVSSLLSPKIDFYDVKVENCKEMTFSFENGVLVKNEFDDSFFQNRQCRYFPCHETDDIDSFNCMFCYCPRYYLGEKCGGNFEYSKSGIKSCSNCIIPHKGRIQADFV